jgi:hypothetical protein
MLTAVRIASPWPTHSSTEWAPSPPGEFAHALDGGVAALADDVGRTESARQRDAVDVAPEHDDPLGAKPACRYHAAEAHRAVSHNRRHLAGTDLR